MVEIYLVYAIAYGFPRASCCIVGRLTESVDVGHWAQLLPSTHQPTGDRNQSLSNLDPHILRRTIAGEYQHL